MSRRLLPTLRSRALAVALVAVIPYLIFSAVIAVRWRSHEMNDARQTAMGLVRQIALAHDRRMQRSRGFMTAMAGLAGGWPDPPGLRSDLEDGAAAVPLSEPYVAVFSTDGRLLAPAHPALQDLARRPSFSRALRTSAPAADDYSVDQVSGLASAALAYPVVDAAGRARSVVMSLVDLRWVQDLSPDPMLPASSMVLIFDGSGTILAQHPPGEWVGRSGRGEPVVEEALRLTGEGTVQAAGFDTLERIFAFRRLSQDDAGHSLHVAVGLPSGTATAQVDDILRADVIALGVALIFALVLASTGTDRFVIGHVQALVAATRQFGRGDMRARVGDAGGPRELAQLGEAFDRMADALEARARESAAQSQRIALAQRRFQSLIENSDDGIMLQDVAGRILYESPSTARILGYEPGEMLGRQAMEVVHPDDREQFEAQIADILQNPRAGLSVQIRMRRKDGAWRWLDCDVRNLLDDPAVAALVTNYRDVTAYRDAQEQLRRAHDELERRVQERTAELIRVNQSLSTEVLERERAEQAAHASEARFRLLLDSAAEGILGLDEEGRCTFCNPAAQRLLGYPDRTALIGAHLHSLIHGSRPDGSPYPEDACAARHVLTSMEGTHVDAEVFWRADGTSFPVEYWSDPLRVENRVVGIVLSFFDITERRRAEEAMQKLSRAIEQTGDSVFVTNRDGVIEYVNPAFERLTGYTREEAIGRTPKLMASGVHDAAFFARLWRTILSGDVYRTTITNRTKDGTLYDEDQTATPVRDATGTITHFVVTGRDITARKRTEQAVRRLNHLLEQETTRIANLLHDEAGQFLTSAHILIADVARDLPPAQRERLQSVRRNLDQVEEQLRTVSHDLHPRILQDLGLVETIRRRATAFSRRTGVATTVSAPDDFWCPPAVATILYRLVQESLNNVARHAKAGSVTITLGADGPSLSCAISDDGAGFDTETVLRNTLTPSLGLRGMRDRVEALGGTLSIVSAPGNGTEVRAVITEEATDVSPDTAGR